ncbi:MAG: alpha-L-fucosidase [Prevotellaceae bacterium]|jgi:alpha-L-fucosidase|nr:alpha-L-fucosidase [Prevotellaceae bacterium]
MKKTVALFILALLIVSCKPSKDYNSVVSLKGTAVFQPDWKNIAANYSCPEWFMDAKFGIFIGWGVYSVPAFGNDWYPRNMYMKDAGWAYKLTYDYHLQTYGEQTKFGYKDFIPMFKAEKFDAGEWVALFKAAGAKYVVPIAEHHDGFAMYNSDRNQWNAVKMGPKKDIVGLLKAAAEKEGLVFGLSSHRLENAWYFNGGMRIPSDVQDTTISLYGRRLPQKEYWQPSEYDEAVQLDWLAHTHELIDKYQPQLFWFDWTVDKIPNVFNKFMAYYYNNAVDWGKGVVVNTKQGYPTNVQVWDVERGKSGKMMKFPWQTDTSIGKKSWGYIEGEENKTPEQIVHDLIDIVSKNGNLLLNIGPRSDGSITDEQTAVLLSIGKWLKINGEAIYGTRCWKKFGEGTSESSKGSMSDFNATTYTAADLRFTTKGNDFYAIMLNWDENGALIQSLNKNAIADAKILSVKMLGSDEKIAWTQTDEGLQLSCPKIKPCEFAYSFKITFDRKVGEHLTSEAVDEMTKHGG